MAWPMVAADPQSGAVLCIVPSEGEAIVSPYSVITLEIRLAYAGEPGEDTTAAVARLEAAGENAAEALARLSDELSVLGVKVKP